MVDASSAAAMSRRERQIMDVIYKLGRASAAEVMAQLDDPPSYSAVRTTLRILEGKGHVRHEQDGPRYVFTPIVNRDRARRSALKHLVNTFFDGSTEEAVAALLRMSPDALSNDERDRLARLIELARQEGR
jgi:predicted transcriptional regulator